MIILDKWYQLTLIAHCESGPEVETLNNGLLVSFCKKLDGDKILTSRADKHSNNFVKMGKDSASRPLQYHFQRHSMSISFSYEL